MTDQRAALQALIGEMRSAVTLAAWFHTPVADAQLLLDWADELEALIAERDRLMDTVADMVERERFDEVCQRCVDAEAQIAALIAERDHIERDWNSECDARHAAEARADAAEAALRKYLDNHCANADAEGVSALCECRLCLETRQLLAIHQAQRAHADDA